MDTPTHPAVETALQQFVRGELDNQHLLLALMTHPEWLVPLHDEATHVGAEPQELNLGPDEGADIRALKDADSRMHFNVFSSMAQLKATRQARGAQAVGTRYLKLPGYVAFSFEGDTFAYLNLNPDSDGLSVHYQAAEFGKLRDWARVVGLDILLGRLQLNAEVAQQDVEVLVAHQHFYVVATETAEETRLSLAPDPQNRVLAAVFTARMAAEPYLAWVQEALPAQGHTHHLVQLDGQMLFRELLALPLDGIVFNSHGPLQPRAFSHTLSGFLLGMVHE